MVKKIDVKPYFVDIPTNEGMKRTPYDVVQSIENVLMAKGNMTAQQLTMSELLKNARIMEKLKANIEEEDKTVLVEDADYNAIKKSFNAFRGFGVNEVELCKRIEEAKAVKVKENKKKKGNKK